MAEKNIQELIDDFVNASRIHCETIETGDWKTANKQAKKIHRSFNKIKEFGKNGQDELIKLVDYEDNAVACMAAAYSLSYNAEKSKIALLRISKKPGAIGLMAKQGLKRWENSPTEIE
jgi:hypothetical protein